MIQKHLQQNTDPKTGDCLKTCIASLLGLKLDDVPDFTGDNNPNWWLDAQEWARVHGWQILEFCLSMDGKNTIPLSQISAGMHCILSGKTEARNRHCILGAIMSDMSLAEIHNPLPGAKLAIIESLIFFVPRDVSKYFGAKRDFVKIGLLLDTGVLMRNQRVVEAVTIAKEQAAQ